MWYLWLFAVVFYQGDFTHPYPPAKAGQALQRRGNPRVVFFNLLWFFILTRGDAFSLTIPLSAMLSETIV